MATLLFLGASISQLPAIRYAREAGHRIVAVDGDPNAVAFALAEISEAVDFTDVARVAEIGAREGAQGVLAVCTDRAVVPAAAVAEALGLPGIGVDVARVMTNKAAMRASLDAANVRQPPYAIVSKANDIAKLGGSVPFPAVLKPTDSGGQRGVFLVDSPEEAERMLAETLALSRSGTAILEEYVSGVELNGLLVVRGGNPTLLTLSDRLRPRGLGFGVGWIHSFPSSLPAGTLAEAQEVAFAAVEALGLEDGIAFPQLIVSSSGVQVVEVAARIAAGQMADLVDYGTGISLFAIAIAQALGEPVDDDLVTPAFVRPLVIRFLTARPGVLPVGTVTAIEGLDRVRAAPGVLEANLYFDVGATIGPLQVDADRRGYVIATAGTAAAALQLADEASNELEVRTSEQRVGRNRSERKTPMPSRRLQLVAALLLVLLAVCLVVLTEDARIDRALVIELFRF
jgi:biotin carboxylase